MSITRKEFNNSDVCDSYITRQIIPAHGVVAIYKNGDGTEDRFPVVCWALLDIVDDDGTSPFAMYQNVEGMVLLEGSDYLDFCGQRAEGVLGFVGYEYTDNEQ